MGIISEGDEVLWMTLTDEEETRQQALTVIGILSYSYNTHWLSGQVLLKRSEIFSCVFITSEHCSHYPVCPVEEVTIYSYTKAMLEMVSCHNLWKDFRKNKQIITVIIKYIIIRNTLNKNMDKYYEVTVKWIMHVLWVKLRIIKNCTFSFIISSKYKTNYIWIQKSLNLCLYIK